jgi:MFS family permease
MSEAADHPAKGAWTAAVLLALTSAMSWADRALPALLMEPIKSAFAISDTQLALLTGFTFAAAIAVFALPLSWIADRFNRVWLISGTIVVWCLMTIGSAFAHDFWSLFVLRIGVGIGEAALQPAAYSLLADLFPAKRLPRPLAVYAFCTVLGPIAAQSGGGALYELFQHAGAVHALPIAAADAWRWTTAVFGVLGLALAPAVFFLTPEPRRRLAAAAPAAQGGGISFIGFLRATAFFFVPYTLAMVAYCLFESGALTTWVAPFFARTYHWSIGYIGQVIGLTGVLAAVLGMPFGVWISQVVNARLGRVAPVATVCVLLTLSLPFVALYPFAPTGMLAAAGFTLIMIAGSAATVVAPVVFTSTAPSHLRARMLALSSLFFGLLGRAMGAVLYAGFTDKVLHDPARLNVSLSVVSVLLMAVCLPALFIADRRYDRAKAIAEAEDLAPTTSAIAIEGAPA